MCVRRTLDSDSNGTSSSTHVQLVEKVKVDDTTKKKPNHNVLEASARQTIWGTLWCE